ncbi:unnamed protein product [Danaus chrysippus]|uniref:(African queen) hypothetical protein n=1 Tax=Danaus chrysippus TaxID=151541 RepID=A0A8J2QWP7_9NEOP|nr:unnamed protein product [Danaus chrysippus]
MKTTKRRTDRELEHSKDDILNKKQEERTKKSVYSVSTPRNFIQKSSTADIYAGKDAVKAPKKIASNRNSDVSPMKDLLKSSSSSVSQISTSSKNKTPAKNSKAIPLSARSAVNSIKAPNRKLPLTNVTVNSPIVKRKLNLDDEGAKVLHKTESKVARKRERTNTRTLDEAEIKVLTSELVDNNTELLKLNKKLSAQPKAFFIDLEDKKTKDKSSGEEVSYEDDFESYESDFDSYHSESNRSSTGDVDCSDDDGSDKNVHHESSSKEESKLDSGNFDLPERNKDRINPMEYIDEGPESYKKISLTDEGFQDMSSGMSSMKTLHVDILDRPLFIDFTKSKANRKRRKIFERLKRRAEDILSMVKFHEISYNLFEMKPIPYELYMASYGRYNYIQTSVQTFDDGVSEEVQTEEVLCSTKWTQHPIEFSNQIIHLNEQDHSNNSTQKFNNNNMMNEANIIDTYIKNPLRIYFEQKNGAGNDKVLPYIEYRNKLKKNQYDANKLRKFMKRVESRVFNVLSKNAGNINMSNLVKTSKFPFSSGYMSICTKSLNEKSLLKDTEITGVVFSDSKSNLIITIHKKCTAGVFKDKCALCLWDLSVARVEPLKILMASDNVKIGKFRGSTDGYFVGALEDGSINLWDLSEEAWWSNDVTTLVDDSVKESNLTQCELDREWNLRNNSNYLKQQQYILQVSAFTSSGINVCEDISVDRIVGLEFTDYTGSNGSDVIGQICSLQRIGILTIWSIIRERRIKSDIGKALWSKIKLKRSQVIVLSEHLEANRTIGADFNLNSAKKRIAARKREKNIIKRQNSRPKSSSTLQSDKTNSVAIDKIDTNFWVNGIICSDLKIIHLKVDNYLIGKNFGEVLCCMKKLGAVIINRFPVASSSTMITCLQTTKLPYFLAATDTGTINLCSLIDYRVLLTLDCRNISTPSTEKCLSDNKGRFVESRTLKYTPIDGNPITSLYWSYTNPLRILCVQSKVCVWSLAQSDVNALCADRALCCAGSDRAFVTWVTPYPDKTPINSNLTIIDVSFLTEFSQSMENKVTSLSDIKTLTRNISTATTHHSEFRSALVKNKYDAVVTEWFLSDMEAGYAAIQQAPWILFSGVIYHPHLEYLIDTTRSIPVHPTMIFHFPIPMNFLQRCLNTLIYVIMKLDSIKESFVHASLYNEWFSPLAEARGVTLPPFSEAVHNISILFINSHPSYSTPNVLPPNAIEIGGFFVDEAQELPKDLKNLVDGFQQGFIYFSMGSLLKSSNFPPKMKQELIKVLGELPFPVLWKYEEDIENLPKNIHVRKWIPQVSILAHPNIKLFISHCGLLSSLEALHHGVPMLAVPVFGDQPHNADTATREGRAIRVNFDENLPENLKIGLKQILSDDKYNQRAKYLSKLFRNRPVSPASLIVHYIELAIETKGAQHLRSKAQLYSWYQLLMLDQLAVFSIIFYLIFKMIKMFIGLVKKLFKNDKKKTE